jgi:hypothetical protein
MHITAKDRLIPDIQSLLALRYQAHLMRMRSQKRVNNQLSGHYVSFFKGRGFDFNEIRPYQPGDEIRHIDWRVTARTGKPYTRLYNEEKERPIFILMDYTHSMQFGTFKTFKSILGAHIASLLAWSAYMNHDRVGGIIFNDDHYVHQKPVSARTGLLHYMHSLADPNFMKIINPSYNTLMERYIQKLSHMTSPGSLIYIISDFNFYNDKETEKILKQYAYLSMHCEVLNINIYDQLERQLPNQSVAFTDPQKRHTLKLDGTQAKIQSQFKNIYHQRQNFLKQLYNRYGINFINLSTYDDYIKKLYQIHR